ncbi:MAG: hypothetical protein AAFQ02_10750 [Bacteroidota bacterium]
MTFGKTVLIIAVAFGMHHAAIGQQRVDLEINTSNPSQRNIFLAKNLNNGVQSSLAMRLESGVNNDQAVAIVSAFGGSYSASPGYGGYALLGGTKSGIILRSASANGDIRFITGGTSVLSNTNMFLSSIGRLGVGTTAPKAQVEVAEGDVYISEPGEQLILRSPDGSTCGALSVTNAGAMNFSQIPCPN